jgi:uncharacterized OsmC-like protein
MNDTPQRGRDQAVHTWSVRVSGISETESKVYAGRNTFSIGKQADFTGDGAHPSAVELLLGALGSDLVNGFRRLAEKRGIEIEAIESVVSGRLGNPLVFLGVVGAEGNPGFESISATVYVSADAEQPTLEEVWKATLKGSPLVRTLEHSTTLSLSIQPMV